MRIASYPRTSGKPVSLSDGRERLLLAAVLTALFLAGYFGIGLATDPAQSRSLSSALDERIPFMAHAAWIYLCIFPAALSPLFLVHDRAIFRCTALAYAVAMAVSFVCFVIFPVNSSSLRVPLHELDLSLLSDRVVALIYALDPPNNLFPSLHLSIVVLAAMSLWRAGRVSARLAVVGVLLITVSVCLVKQHYVLDAAGGLALGALVGELTLSPRPEHEG
jgi:membrane-associated phospholipid phosphatase